MKSIYANQDLAFDGPSIFLAGPTPRDVRIVSWRPRAVQLLNDSGFKGIVLIPERQDWAVHFDYLDQVEWEFAGLELATVLLFWIPRNVKTLPGFTTNVEFGRYAGSGRLAYGSPVGAPHTRYLDWLYQKLAREQIFETLEQVISEAIRKVKLRRPEGN